MWIDVVEEEDQLCLTFTDNGCGMTPNKLHKMLRLDIHLNMDTSFSTTVYCGMSKSPLTFLCPSYMGTYRHLEPFYQRLLLQKGIGWSCHWVWADNEWFTFKNVGVRG